MIDKVGDCVNVISLASQVEEGDYDAVLAQIIMQRFVEAQSALHTLISVVKVRGSRHSREFRPFEITDEGIVIGDAPAPFEGVLHGPVRLRGQAGS